MPRRNLLLAILLGIALLFALLGGANAAEQPVASDAPLTIEAGGEEADADPFRVTGGMLAVAILLPLFFVGGTGATFIWAIRNRARREEADWEMPWWRTRRWYSHEEEEA